MWVTLPELFSDYLPDRTPGRGYTSFGLIYEPGRDPRFDLPIGMSMRRVQGIDRVYFTCSVCHAGSVRAAPDAAPTIVLGMPANTVNFGGLAQFLRSVAADNRFVASQMVPRIEAMAALRRRDYTGTAIYQPAELGVLDRLLLRQIGVSMMRATLNELMAKLSFVDFTTWGPGRVDTFGPPKALLGFRMDMAPAHEKIGVSDFPSVWHQRARKGMSLHWDGNNCSVDERNLSAAYGTGATPVTLDRDGLFRIADYLWSTAVPPPFPPDRIDQSQAAAGARVYGELCRTCHGEGASPFRTLGDGLKVGQVTPIAEIGTDRARLDSYTRELAVSQNTLYAGLPADAASCAAYVESVCRANQVEAEVPRPPRPLLPVALRPLPQDQRLCQPAARRAVAARAVPAQRLGADTAGAARAGSAAARPLPDRLRRLRLRRRRLRVLGAGGRTGRLDARHHAPGQRQRRARGRRLRHRVAESPESGADRVP